jgi:hypothetical protein
VKYGDSKANFFQFGASERTVCGWMKEDKLQVFC